MRLGKRTIGRLAAAVGLVVAGLATPAVGAPAADGASALRHQILDAGAPPTGLLGTVDQAIAWVHGGLAEQQAQPAGSAMAGPSEQFRPAGDLDGDGLRDVLAVRRGEQVAALSGADGASLWVHPLDTPLGSATGARVGAPADSGALTLETERRDDVAGMTVRHTFTALDAAGTPLWSTTVEGTLLELPTGDALAASDLPVGLALTDVDGDGAVDLRLTLVEGAAPTLLGYQVSTVVIAGADGALGEPTETVAVDGLPLAEVVPDLNGDGRDEVAVLGLHRDRSTLIMLDGRTGAVLWRNDDVEQYSLYVADEYWVAVYEPVFTALGDATGDGVPELRLLQFDRDERRLYATAVDGATGEVGFSAGVIHPLGDVTGDARAEIGTVSATREGGVARYRYDAMNLAGEPLRTVHREIAVGDRPLAYSWIMAVGDADDDGVHDLEQDVAYGPAGDRVRDSVLLSGAAMAERWHPQTGWFSASFDGRGVDHLTVQASEVRARNGATGATLWSAATSSALLPWDVPLDLDGDGRHELLLDGVCSAPCDAGGGRPLTLLSADGKVRWERRR